MGAYSSVNHALFQAAMWRRYAMDWDRPEWSDLRRWVEGVLRVSRTECLRRARHAVEGAKALRAAKALAQEKA